uniref:RNase H type-1 domain-containing protein n=1 Tax=Aegilops tauschii subsp. strangulata TaxID=200361 RepID=A0A453M720_AEGTS
FTFYHEWNRVNRLIKTSTILVFEIWNNIHKYGECLLENTEHIIRDHDGDVVVAAAGRLAHAQDVLHTEAEECLQALYKAQELGINQVVVETDAMLLVQAIKTSNFDLSPNGVLFREIKAFTTLNFSDFSIINCPRACNKVADVLALYGSKM